MYAKLISKVAIGAVVVLFLFINQGKEPETKQETETQHAVITNRINLSNDIISNLGITFDKVQSGKLGTWIAVPGKLEVPRESRYILSAPTKARIFWLKDRLSWVEENEALATIESSALSEIQQELAASRQSLSLAMQRKNSNNGSQLRAYQAERKYRENIGRMAVLTGLSSEALEKEHKGEPYWSTLKKLEVRAPGDGYLAEVTASNGELIEEGTELGLVLNVTRLAFRGLVAPELHSEIPEKAPVRINIDKTVSVESQLKGPLPIGDKLTSKVWIEADVPNENKLLIDGAPVIAHVQIKGSNFEEAIVPESCVVFDDLQAVIFKRDAAKPTFVIRTPVEIGNRSGGKMEVLSGILEEDEIVCAGIHQLKQMETGKTPEDGHLHSDGTWHDGEE